MESRKDKFVGNRYSSGPRTPKEDKTEMIFGSRPILEAFSAGKELEKIFLLRGSRNPTTDEIMMQAKRFEVPVVMVQKSWTGSHARTIREQ
ncbi:hypothetical protein GCM10028895_41000 [Pontibacter rugosus]